MIPPAGEPKPDTSNTSPEDRDGRKRNDKPEAEAPDRSQQRGQPRQGGWRPSRRAQRRRGVGGAQRLVHVMLLSGPSRAQNSDAVPAAKEHGDATYRCAARKGFRVPRTVGP